MGNFMREISPEELGEPTPGRPGWDPDLHSKKYRVISEKMQEEEQIAEKKHHGQFVDQPVKDAQQRLLSLIPKNNLRIPFNWFDNDGDAETFIKAVARTNDVGIDRFGKTRTSTSLCMFLDVVSRNRGLRMKKEGDPPHMSLQERRNRHWQSVIDESSLARDFSQRLVRHVTLMLVAAYLAFANSTTGPANSYSTLNDKTDKVSEWLTENDPEDVKSFEYLQPERPRPHAPIGKVKGNKQRKGNRHSLKRKLAGRDHLASADSKRQRQTNTPLSPARPAETQPPLPPLRADQTRRPLPVPGPDVEVELPERIMEAKGGKSDWNERT